MPIEGHVGEMEMWGGMECTINRVGDRFCDQFEMGGHYQRTGDVQLIADLGIKALRFPALWERHVTGDWRWLDSQLNAIRAARIEPILGLVHHGSGPRETNLLDPGFAEGLGGYARAVAERYPWARYYTPVNEPLTTARFSCLYGHWFPHNSDARSFLQSLLVECQATRAAMRAIRTVNPDALLVQTEDMGKTHSTELVAYQADFDNCRRWLSLDLLCGRLNKAHPLWNYLIDHRVDEQGLLSFCDDPCPPDIIGINYYVTSERFLDDRFDQYPERNQGGNGQHRYADVSALRVSAPGFAGPEGILREVWDRYRIPIAVTEAHIGCTREEQMRWLLHVHRAARKVRSEGADVRAVTAWSLFGAFDWCTLLTRSEGNYESGVFDLRSPIPRKTAMVPVIKSLAAGTEPEHPILTGPGWWHRPIRLLYDPVTPAQRIEPSNFEDLAPVERAMSPILITGATGTLGRAFARLCEVRGLAYYLLGRGEMDICDADNVTAAIRELKPWAIINTAGYVRVDQGETERDRCFRENAHGPITLAKVCARAGVKLATFSSDLVFDGTKASPYFEDDPVSPLNVYGESKVQAEQGVLAEYPGALVLRTSAFFGPWDVHNFITATLNNLRRGESVQAPFDAVVSPTYVPDLVNATLDLVIDGEQGIWHLANDGEISWAELGMLVAQRAGLDPSLIEGRPMHKFHLPAPRPAYSVLRSRRGQMLPTLQTALDKYFLEATSSQNQSAEALRMHPTPEQISSIPCANGRSFALPKQPVS